VRHLRISQRDAAIPDDTISSAVSFRDRMVAKIIEIKLIKIFACAFRRIREIQSTAVFYYLFPCQ